jgi:hypothetical protein
VWLLLLLGAGRQGLSLPTIVRSCGGKDSPGRTRLCSLMVGWVLLLGRTGLAQAGQRKLMQLSLHNTTFTNGCTKLTIKYVLAE